MFLLPILAATLALGPRQVHEAEDLPAGPDVRVEAFADVSHARPGARFHIAVHLEITAEHWHVYWRNPGDSGMPTRVSVQAPEGVEAGPTAFPVPRRFEGPEGVSYGYEDEVVLFVPIHVPEGWSAPGATGEPPATLELAVEVDWLVCRKACFLGSARRTVEIPLAAAGAPVQEIRSELLAPFRAMLPRPPRPSDGLRLAWRGTAERATLLVHPEATASVRFFPDFDGAFALSARKSEGGLELDYRRELGDAKPRARGVLLVERGGERLALELDSTFETTTPSESPLHR